MATSDNDRVSSTRLKEFADSLATRIKGIFYKKPSTGIPKDDLASGVQTSLGKADTALQSHQDISGKLNANGSNATTDTLYQIVTVEGNVNNSNLLDNAKFPFAYLLQGTGFSEYITGSNLKSAMANYLGIALADDGTKTFDGTATKATYNSNGEALDDTYIRKDGTNDDDTSDKNPSGFHRILWNNTTESYSAQNTGDYFVYINGDVSSTSYAQKINAENLSKVMQSCIESRNTLKAYSATTATTCTGNSATADTAKNCSGTAVNATNATNYTAEGGIASAFGTKADKVSGATDGTLAALDSNGNLKDSGYKIITVEYDSTTYTYDQLVSYFTSGYDVVCVISTNGLKLHMYNYGVGPGGMGHVYFISVYNPEANSAVCVDYEPGQGWRTYYVSHDVAWGDLKNIPTTISADISGNAATATSADKLSTDNKGCRWSDIINSDPTNNPTSTYRITFPAKNDDGSGTSGGTSILCHALGDNSGYSIVFSIGLGFNGTSFNIAPKLALLYCTEQSAATRKVVVTYNNDTRSIYIHLGAASGTSYAWRLNFSMSTARPADCTWGEVADTDEGYIASQSNVANIEANVGTASVGSAIGDAGTPVYVQPNGFVKACDLEDLSSNILGDALPTSGNPEKVYAINITGTAGGGASTDAATNLTGHAGYKTGSSTKTVGAYLYDTTTSGASNPSVGTFIVSVSKRASYADGGDTIARSWATYILSHYNRNGANYIHPVLVDYADAFEDLGIKFSYGKNSSSKGIAVYVEYNAALYVDVVLTPIGYRGEFDFSNSVTMLTSAPSRTEYATTEYVSRTLSSSVGASNQPVYVEDGIVKACALKFDTTLGTEQDVFYIG